MAKNTGKGFRKGAVDSRTQFFNQRIKRWVERDTNTGEILNVKDDSKPFKGVAKEVDDRRK